MKSDRPLIVSYSYSGNTHRIAQELQALTGADWCEVHPWQLYPTAFPQLLRQVKREVRSGYRPRLLPGARPARPYSVIFVGTPNWCSTVAPPIASWLCKNDLSGKTVFPFYSHCGGAAGDFQKEILRLCPKADVREPLGVIDDGDSRLPEILSQWLQQIGTAAGPPAGGAQQDAANGLGLQRVHDVV